MGKLNLAEIRKQQQPPATREVKAVESVVNVDSQISTYKDNNRSLAAKQAKKPEYRADGTEVKRSKDAQIILRASPHMRRELKRWALDEDTTVQRLLMTGLQTLRRDRGLPELAD